MQRLFVAVWPSESVVEELIALPRKPRPGIRWVEPQNWHTTLRFLGDADVGEVAAQLDGVNFEPIKVRYGPGVDVLNERVIIVPVHGLDELASTVNRATADLGTDRPRKRFVGHLTLGRLKSRPPVLKAVGMPISAEQRVNAFHLVGSTLRPQGVRYEILESFPATAAHR
ncbi:MAG: RNA 2',3'-cyclic phosphodiesterase [Acidimicrobiales bacterium]|nr:RNA 2',3'-cyclic phosphodiesterase [Acidimicrobiales bacterium]